MPAFDVTGFFSKKESFANSHYIFKSKKASESVPAFDVRGFFSKKESFAN